MLKTLFKVLETLFKLLGTLFILLQTLLKLLETLFKLLENSPKNVWNSKLRHLQRRKVHFVENFLYYPVASINFFTTVIISLS